MSKLKVDFGAVDMDVLQEDISAASASATRAANSANTKPKAPYQIAKHASHLSKLSGNAVDCTPVVQSPEERKAAQINNIMATIEKDLHRMDVYGLENALEAREDYFVEVDIAEHEAAQERVQELMLAYADGTATLPAKPTLDSSRKLEAVFTDVEAVRLGQNNNLTPRDLLNSIRNCSPALVDKFTVLLTAGVKALELRKSLDSNHAKDTAAHTSKVNEVNSFKSEALKVAKASPRPANQAERMIVKLKQSQVQSAPVKTTRKKTIKK